MLMHTPASVWEDQACPVTCDQWDDITAVGSELPEMTEFSVGLNLSVEMYTPYGDQELFPMPSMDDYSVSMMTYTTTAIVDDTWQSEKTKKRARSPSFTIDTQRPLKRTKTDDSCSTLEGLQQLPLDAITDELSAVSDSTYAVVLPSPEVPRSPPTEPASSPQTVVCASPKVPYSPACETADLGEELYGEWGHFGDEIRPRTRAQRKRFQAVVPPTKKQRNKLARDISSLGETHLREVLRMVNAAEKDVGGGAVQVEFDIADVDDNLFYELQEFVETCIQQLKELQQQQLQSRPRSKVSAGKSPSVTQALSAYHASPHKAPKSAGTPRKRGRKPKKAKASPEASPAVPLKGAAAKKLTVAETALFQMEERLTLAQTEEGEEDEIVDIGE